MLVFCLEKIVLAFNKMYCDSLLFNTPIFASQGCGDFQIYFSDYYYHYYFAYYFPINIGSIMLPEVLHLIVTIASEPHVHMVRNSHSNNSNLLVLVFIIYQ